MSATPEQILFAAIADTLPDQRLYPEFLPEKTPLPENAMFSQETLYFQAKPKDVKIVRGFECSVESWKYSGKVKDKYTASVGFKLKSRPHDVVLP